MKLRSTILSHNFLICLFSIFLLAAGFSRYIETDSGNILIHDIDIENYEGFIYGGRLFRPIQASSMNQRPGILLVFGPPADRYTGDHIAMELARRGFVVLSIEDFEQGTTAPRPDYKTENMIDAGYTFLSTRTFTDHGRLGLAAFYSAAEKTTDSQHFQDFNTSIFIAPSESSYTQTDKPDLFLIPVLESIPNSISTLDSDASVNEYKATYAGMLFHVAVIADLLEHFHKVLSIPNDSPFWFSTSQQRAQILLLLRLVLLVLLCFICSLQSTLITEKIRNRSLSAISGFIFPLLFFLIIEETMNFFMISVRLGTPFNYLPRVSRLIGNFSAVMCLFWVCLSLICSIFLGKKSSFLLSDLLLLIGGLICLFGFMAILFTTKSGWDILGIADCRLHVITITLFAAAGSIFLRIPGKNNHARNVCAVLNGIIFYWISSNLPLNIFTGS